MDHRLLNHYNKELTFMYEMGAEFAHSNPKIAGRLGMENEQCADPYVERLLEGFAFMAARVQLKLEEEFPKFCQQLLSMVYPDFLRTTQARPRVLYSNGEVFFVAVSVLKCRPVASTPLHRM
jgi:type VI secretion system protein ImpG